MMSDKEREIRAQILAADAAWEFGAGPGPHPAMPPAWYADVAEVMYPAMNDGACRSPAVVSDSDNGPLGGMRRCFAITPPNRRRPPTHPLQDSERTSFLAIPGTNQTERVGTSPKGASTIMSIASAETLHNQTGRKQTVIPPRSQERGVQTERFCDHAPCTTQGSPTRYDSADEAGALNGIVSC